MQRFWFMLLGVGATVGCSNADNRSPVLDDGDDPRRNGGQPIDDGTSDAGLQPVEDDGPVGAPLVSITQPADLQAPDDGSVLTQNEVSVLCEARPDEVEGAQPVDASSVQITMLGSDGQELATAPGEATTNPNEYSAVFVVAQVAAGPVSFRCTASDTAPEPLTRSVSIHNFVDHGPSIEVSSPVLDGAYALEGAIAFAFTVMPAPLAEGDEGANVDSVALSVDGIPIELQPFDETQGSYELSLNLDDQTMFPNPPVGSVNVQVMASNSRQPASATRILNHPFVVDGAGPDIEITSPEASSVIGGEVILRFVVTDEQPGSGVDTSTVAVSLGGNEYFYDPAGPWTEDGDEFTYRFDSANLQGVAAQLTINVRAADNAGNESIGQSHLLYLDNFPPIVDLDPGNVRTLNAQTGQCSLSFDPLGDAVGDFATSGPVDRAALYRALVWDRTNASQGQTVLYYAGVDQESVRLYLQPDANTPLVVDTDGDGVCDDIGNAEDLDFVRLGAVEDQGLPPYGPDDVEIPAAEGCEVAATPTSPAKLCSDHSSDLSIVIRHADGERVIYGVGTLMDLECTGVGWELGALLNQDGWVCLAARASDSVGNVGVSRPIPVCMDDSLRAGSPDCATMSTPIPSCTDGCTLPPAFGPAIIDL